jgi:hypothetical protein
MYEISKAKEIIEDYLSKKIIKDIEILENQIILMEASVKDHISSEQYYKLTSPMRPQLLTNPINIIEEYQAVGNQTNKRQFTILQQKIYKKLA